MKVNSLHYLRGLLAIGVMLFHYASWPLEQGFYLDANNILSRFGNYGVSLFFILSGLTLYHVYSGKGILRKENLKIYFTKRIFRIYPLFWACTIFSIFFTQEHYSLNIIFLNLSGLFGLTYSNFAILHVAWSVGNEILFYCAFPILLYLIEHRNFFLRSIPVLLFLITFYYGVTHITPETDASLLHSYFSPLNNFYFFIGGILTGVFAKEKKFPIWLMMLLLTIALCLFFFYPVPGKVIYLICGSTRLLFSIICFTICFTLYKIPLKLPKTIHSFFFFLGTVSYSIYLIHPIVSNQLLAPLIWIESHYTSAFNPQLFFPVLVIECIFLSYLSNRFIEIPGMKLGNKILSPKIFR